MVQTKKSVADLARTFGLPEDKARELALEACKGIPWANRKFMKFLVDNTDDQLWEKDDVFKVHERFLPDKAEYENALSRIYAARGKLTHQGRAFPASSEIGVRSSAAWRAFDFDWLSKEKPFPPVVWFERVVNRALNGFIENAIRADDEGTEAIGR